MLKNTWLCQPVDSRSKLAAGSQRFLCRKQFKSAVVNVKQGKKKEFFRLSRFLRKTKACRFRYLFRRDKCNALSPRNSVSGQDDPMFSPKTKHTLFSLTLVVATITAANAEAQSTASAQYQARVAAMQQAQARGQMRAQQVEAQPIRVASNDQRVVRQAVPAQTASTPVARTARTYQPRHTRTAQLITEGSIVDGGAPIMAETVLSQPIMTGNVIGGPMESEVVYGNEVTLDGCDSCGDSGSYFVDDCCGRGGCPEGACWTGPLASSLGRALRTGSYFFGATAFRHPAFSSPVGTDLVQDSNFGAYAGFNLGIPLCRLFCGRISGQFGIRNVQSNFSGNEFSDIGRDQLFITAGLYRRVDYGLQAGLVVDVLSEEFFAESDIAQLRGEVSWAYPTGAALGFRFTSSQQNDTSSGTFGGTPFTGLTTTTDENYRIFLRKVVATGGWEEIFAGWTSEEHFAIGADFDLPVAQYMALQAGVAYYLSDEAAPNTNLGATRVEDSFNLYVGFAFRPQGRSYYRSYDRPLLPVADNGTMLIRR